MEAREGSLRILRQLPSRAGRPGRRHSNIEKESQSTTYLRYVASSKYPKRRFLPKRCGREIVGADLGSQSSRRDMTPTTSICSMIGPICCGGSLMSTVQFESSQLVTADVALNSYAAPWNSSCWLPAIAIPMPESRSQWLTPLAATSG